MNRSPWWYRFKACPERGPQTGYQCVKFNGHKGDHHASVEIDKYDDRYYDEYWAAPLGVDPAIKDPEHG